MRDTVRVGDERVHHTDQPGVKVLKGHCHGADDDKDVRSAEEHHQVVENIAHRSRHVFDDRNISFECLKKSPTDRSRTDETQEK